MRDFAKLIQLLKPYKYKVLLSSISHLLMAVFTIISIPLIIPIFHFLFATRPDQVEKPDNAFAIIDWLQYYFLQMLDSYGQQKTLIYACLFILLTIFLKNLFRYLALYIMVPVRSNVARDLRSRLFDGFLAFSFDESQRQSKGDLITRISSDVQEIEWNMLRFIDTMIKSPIIIIGAVMLMISISVKLSLFVVVLMVFTAVVIGTLSRRLKRQSANLQSRLSRINEIISDSLQGALHIRIYDVLTPWKKRFEDVNSSYKKKFDSVTRRQELSSPLSEFLGITVVVALLWYGAILVMDKQLAAETFFAFVIAFYHVIEPLKSFSTAYYYLKRGSASLERIDELSIAVDQGSDDVGGVKFEFNNSLRFDDVSYAYGEKLVLRNLSFEIRKGEKVALVGPSGAGKSTLLRLILKILNVQSGKITIDDTNLDDISTSDLYKHLGYVSQHSFLYNDSLRNNITLGRKDISDDTIYKCLELAYAKKFVDALPKGLDSQIGEEGNTLSGGEKQRITIARALVHNPEILIFDEPTSALDPGSEQEVSQAVMNVLKDRTAIIIAHRLSTIKKVDHIYVLNEGQIIESGDHDSLSQSGGLYSQYADIQSTDS